MTMSDLDVIRRISQLERRIARTESVEAPAYLDYAMQAFGAHMTIVAGVGNFWPLTTLDHFSSVCHDVLGGKHISWSNIYATTWADRVGAIVFNGTTSHLTRNSEAYFQHTTNFSTGCWVYMNALPGAGSEACFMGRYNTGANQRQWMLGADSANIIFRISSNGTTTQQIAVPISSLSRSPVGRWMHVVGVYFASNCINLVIDGVLAGSLTTGVFAATHPATAKLIFGAYNEGASSFLNGMMSFCWWGVGIHSSPVYTSLYKYSKALFGH